jgi:hypothetical protein
MKELIFTLLLLTGINMWAQDCNKFTTGIFEHETHGLGMLIVERTATHEYMYTENKVFEIHSTIEWVSPCKYILTCEKIINPDLDLQDMVGTKEYVEITEADEEGYTSRTTDSEGNIQTLRLTIRTD